MSTPPSPAARTIEADHPFAMHGPRGRRWGVLLGAGVWLIYLAPAAGQVVGDDWPAWQRVVGAAALCSFVALYLTTLRASIIVSRRRAGARDEQGRPLAGPSEREVHVRAGLLAALAMATGIGFGGLWLVTFAYVAATLAIVLPAERAPRGIVATAVVAELLLVLREPWAISSALWLAFGVLIAGFFSLGFRRMRELMFDLAVTREDNARLAVAEERLRISRDLHDLLGHSLSVIAVKSQLAERLLERDQPERAHDEIRDVRSVARDALHEVRHVVEGYRRRPLATEMAAAEAALCAADVRVATDLPTDPIPDDVEDVVTFVVREASTNVLRHARARNCRITVARRDDVLLTTVVDDGTGIPHLEASRTVSPDRPDGSSHGLLGLAERLLPLGGELRLTPAEGGGTVLEARIPMADHDRDASVAPSTSGTAASPAPPRRDPATLPAPGPAHPRP